MDIDNRIRDLIGELKPEHNILQYAYNSKKFIPGESPVYYSGPYWDDEELVAAIKALLIGKWLSAGEQVKEFEKAFAQKINQSFATMVNSGSSANLIMLAALKKYFQWKDQDEIIVSVVGFPTTVSTIVQNNLKPVFVDIELFTLNFNLEHIEEKITKKTKAIFVSPVLGNPPDFDVLEAICEKYGLKLILDCCDSLGSKWRGKYLTEYAVASSHSFYPAHTISTGEGGMVTTDIREIANLCKRLTSWGRACVCTGIENLLPNGICQHRFDKWLPEIDSIIDHKYLFTHMGYNLKPLDLQGAIGLAQLKKLDEIMEKRNKSKTTIESIFIYVVGLSLKKVNKLSQAEPVWFGTPFVCDTKVIKEYLVSTLEKNKIQTRNYFAGNILVHPGYSHLGNYKAFPEANEVLDRVFFVGAAPHYDQQVFEYIQEVLVKTYVK